MEEAARAFIAKFDECLPHIDGAFAFMAMHGGDYKGPNFADELRALRTALDTENRSGVERLKDAAEQVRLFPEAYDILTRQEMRDAKGNWRSLINQQTKALKKLRAALDTAKDEQ